MMAESKVQKDVSHVLKKSHGGCCWITRLNIRNAFYCTVQQ